MPAKAVTDVHMHAISFYFMDHNFMKIHALMKMTPAMEAGVTDILWSIETSQ